MNRKSEELKEKQISEVMASIENRVRHAYNQGYEQGYKQGIKQEPKIGHWIKHEQNGIGHIECSECLAWFLEPYLLRNSYCPNCGARMESEEE